MSSRHAQTSVHKLAERCSGLGAKTGRPDLTGDESSWWSKEVERKVVQAFSRGFREEVRKQIVIGRHTTLKDALRHALEIEQALWESKEVRGDIFSQ